MLGLDLSKPRVIFEGLTLKRAELLHFEDRAIAELLYASEDHGPVALCIMAAPGGEGEGEVESRDGLNLMYWAESGRRFLLIGDAPAEENREPGRDGRFGFRNAVVVGGTATEEDVSWTGCSLHRRCSRRSARA